MSDWKEDLGLAEDTEVVKIYTKDHYKEEWKEEAEEHGRSLSEHLFIVIQEARFHEQRGDFTFVDSSRAGAGSGLVGEELSELSERVEEVMSLLEEQGGGSGSGQDSDVVLEKEWVRELLDESGQEADELLGPLLRDEDFRSWLEGELEKALYALGADGDVVYRPGNGWKLREDE